MSQRIKVYFSWEQFSFKIGISRLEEWCDWKYYLDIEFFQVGIFIYFIKNRD